MKIGLEIHTQLTTKTKLFCGCSNSAAKEPNTHVCDICMGFPGSKPVINRTAVEYAIMVALIAAVVIGAVTALGTTSKATFNKAVTAMGGTAG